MTSLINISSETTMTSLDFLNNIINPARLEAGESEVRNSVFVDRVRDELDFCKSFAKVYQPDIGRPSDYYDLNIDQMLLVGMRESKAVRRAVLAKLKEMQVRIAKLEEMNQRLTNEDELGRLRQQLAQAQAAQWRAEDMFYFEHNALMRIEDKKSFEEQAAAAIDSARQAWSQRCDMREDLARAEAAISGLQNKLAIALEYAGQNVALIESD